MQALSPPHRRPVWLLAALLPALAPVPLFFLIDRTVSHGGDGLGGVWLSFLAGLACTLACLACVVVGLILRERPRWLALLAPAVLLAPAGWLLF